MNIKHLVFILIIILASCSQQVMIEPDIPTLTSSPKNTEIATLTPPPTQTTISPTAIPPLIDKICSPLENEGLNELPEIVTQTFKMPRSGNDDGHHGVDFAYYRRKGREGIEGLGVMAVLPGTVVTVLVDRWPYGYAIIIETPLEKISPFILEKIKAIEPQPTVVPDPRVNCPPGDLSFSLDDKKQSLYILYGHLQNQAIPALGTKVDCGEVIGAVGNTGYSSNPHLHFETRIGPAGARFDSMAYYTADSTESERYNYCVWRVSNLFQLFDPMILLTSQE